MNVLNMFEVDEREQICRCT